MTVNYTTLLGFGQPVTGTESGTWGDDVNNAVTSYLDIAIAGTLTLTGDGSVTLANTFGTSTATNIGSTTAQYYMLKIVGPLTTTKVITAPSASKTYLINNTDSTYSVTIKASGQTGVTVPAGVRAFVAFNGTDYGLVARSDAVILSNNQILAPDGSAAAPSYSFSSSGNSDNGMYLASANTLGFSTSGTSRLTINGSGNFSSVTDTFSVARISNSTTAETIVVKDNTFPAYNTLSIAPKRIWATTGSNTASSSLSLGVVNYQEAIIIGGNGKVLIGGSAAFPAYQLELATGQFAGPNGAANAPTYSFYSSGNSDTGMYLSGSNELSFSTDAVKRVTISATGNLGVGVAVPDSKITASGLIESTSGGFKFPDGTIQTTAGGSGGSTNWASPGTIGSTTPNTGAFTTLTSTTLTSAGLIYSTVGGFRFPDGSIQTTAASGSAIVNWASPGTIGSTTPNTGAFTTLSASGNFTMLGTGNRIIGDFSNLTVPNRVLFQSSTTNGNTIFGAIPNGTSQTSGFTFFNSSSAVDCSAARVQVTATQARFVSGAEGSGTQLPLVLVTAGVDQVTITPAGNVGVGTGSPVAKLHVNGGVIGKGGAIGHFVDAYSGDDDQAKIANAIAAALAGTNGSNVVVFGARTYDVANSATKSIVIDLAGKGIVLRGTSELGDPTSRTQLLGAGGQTLLQIKDTTNSATSYFDISNLMLYTTSTDANTVGLKIGDSANNWIPGSYAYCKISNVFVHQFTRGFYFTNCRHIAVSGCTARRNEANLEGYIGLTLDGSTYGTGDILFSQCDFDTAPNNNAADCAVNATVTAAGSVFDINFDQCYFYFGSLACVNFSIASGGTGEITEIHFNDCQFDNNINVDPDCQGLRIVNSSTTATSRITRLWVNNCWFFGYPTGVYIYKASSGTIDSININDTIITTGIPIQAINVDTIVVNGNVLRGASSAATNNVTTISSVNTTTDTITTAANHFMVEWQQFFLGDPAPTGLSSGVQYFARDVTATTFKVATTYNGAPIDITGTQTGAALNYYRDGVAIDLQNCSNAVVQGNVHYASATGNAGETTVGIGYLVGIDVNCSNFVVSNNSGDANYAPVRDYSSTKAKTITGNINRYARGNWKGSSSLNWTFISVANGEWFNIEGSQAGGFAGFILVRDNTTGLFSGAFDVGASSFVELSDPANVATFGGSEPGSGWWVTKTITTSTPAGSNGLGVGLKNKTGSTQTIAVSILSTNDAPTYPF